MRHANQYSTRDPRGLYLGLAMTAISYLIYDFYTPFNINRPLIGQVEAKEVPQLIVESLKSSFNSSEVVRIIGELESNGGRNKEGLAGICERQGKSNIYGYGGMRLKICFDTPELARQRVNRWVIKYYEKFDNDLGKVACYYNLGLEVSNCEYYQNYLKFRSK